MVEHWSMMDFLAFTSKFLLIKCWNEHFYWIFVGSNWDAAVSVLYTTKKKKNNLTSGLYSIHQISGFKKMSFTVHLTDITT